LPRRRSAFFRAVAIFPVIRKSSFFVFVVEARVSRAGFLQRSRHGCLYSCSLVEAFAAANACLLSSVVGPPSFYFGVAGNNHRYKQMGVADYGMIFCFQAHWQH
jgi:hypothetical protein